MTRIKHEIRFCMNLGNESINCQVRSEESGNIEKHGEVLLIASMIFRAYVLNTDRHVRDKIKILLNMSNSGMLKVLDDMIDDYNTFNNTVIDEYSYVDDNELASKLMCKVTYRRTEYAPKFSFKDTNFLKKNYGIVMCIGMVTCIDYMLEKYRDDESMSGIITGVVSSCLNIININDKLSVIDELNAGQLIADEHIKISYL